MKIKVVVLKVHQVIEGISYFDMPCDLGDSFLAMVSVEASSLDHLCHI